MFLILHDQLFSHEHLNRYQSENFFAADDLDRMRRFRFHKQKLVLEFAALRQHTEALRSRGFKIHFEPFLKFNAELSFWDKLKAYGTEGKVKKLTTFEIEDRELETRLIDFCKENKWKLNFEPNPMFTTTRQDFEDYLAEAEENHTRPLMRSFYQERRRKLKILVDKKGLPAGGQFTYENPNSFRLSREIRPASPPKPEHSPEVTEACALVNEHFSSHPGATQDFWWPTTRSQAVGWLHDFVDHRLMRYGDYEDSLSAHSDVTYHSALGSSLNLGLVTPMEVIQAALETAQAKEIGLQSLESFIRQLLGMREYARGIHRYFADKMEEMNYWKHSKKLKPCWRDGTTGLAFLDDAIKKSIRLGYNTPMERLMVISNVMLLCEIDPHEVYAWFMEMHVDSTEWASHPNVYGLGQFADGGLYSSRPYICGSAYIRKMSHYEDGPWCDILDGLYWSFVEKHAETFAKNPRIAVALPALRKLDPDRKKKIYADAQNFRQRVTA